MFISMLLVTNFALVLLESGEGLLHGTECELENVTGQNQTGLRRSGRIVPEHLGQTFCKALQNGTHSSRVISTYRIPRLRTFTRIQDRSASGPLPATTR